MNSWWHKRSFKVRLTLWYASAISIVLALFALTVYEIVEHRMEAELDRQLRIDFDLVEAQLDLDDAGNAHWPVQGAHGDEGFARLFAWFELWSDDGKLLLRHWPIPDSAITQSLPAPRAATLQFYDFQLEHQLPVRLMERPARLRGHSVVVRMFRDQSEMRQTLRQIVEVCAITLPFAVALASLGGYLLARRSLAPVTAMAAQARKITSDSLEARLPNPNPHDEFGQLATVTNETLARLESSFKELKRFTADASHELRTPLTALRTVGEVALRRPNDPSALRDAVESMLEEAQRLTELTESLLALARTDSGHSTLRTQPCKLVDIIREIADLLEPLAAEKRQTIQISGEEELTVNIDRPLLRQALLNILHNAIRYSPCDERIAVRHARNGTEAFVEISDAGPGIDSQYHGKIFERFFRVDPSRSRVEGGHGLGLAIARASIERLRGRVEVESVVGQGTTFRIRLPLAGDELPTLMNIQ